MRVTFCSQLLLLFAITSEVSFLAGGSLNNDIVKNWSAHVEGYLLKLAEEGLKTRELQKLYDSANYTVEEKSGFDTINSVKSRLGNYFVKKENTARKVAEAVAKFHDEFYTNKTLQEMAKVSTLHQLGLQHYTDSDLLDTLPKDMEFNTLFKQKVSKSKSSVKISDQVDRNNPKLIEAVFWSSLLDNVFKENLENDPELRWQNFGSIEGFLRAYPSREWSLNFAGFHIDYDPRLRPWYIGATSGPKDIVIILDCSLSMEGNKFHMAKQVAKTVLNTLTKQDFVNVICGHESHWDEVGKGFINCFGGTGLLVFTECVFPEKELERLVCHAVEENAYSQRLKDALIKQSWDGDSFAGPVDRRLLAKDISDVVKKM